VLLLDRNPAGYEGPWETFARMAVLRTPKAVVGSELGIPSLSVRAWFEARYGEEAWDRITWIPRHDWRRYLRWYRGIADLDIRNETSVIGVEPADGVLALTTLRAPGSCDTVLARRIVLATGQDGGGAWKVPEMTERALPASAYAHSNGPIEFERFVGKRIGVLGHGGSAFDAAIMALRNGTPASTFASGDQCCQWSTRINGSNFPPFSRITPSSTTASAGMSHGISTCTTSRRRATPSIVLAGNPAFTSIRTVPGKKSIGPATG
jgi:cation diffusion facilitator CzcD-associated flavoprotein CzcO